MPSAILVILALFCVYLLWVLLPLVPAIIIYRMFPTSLTEVVGKVAGYTIKAGGAFAAYLVVVILTYTQIEEINKAVYSYKRQFWTAVGRIELIDAQNRPIRADRLIGQLKVVTRPEPYVVDQYEFRLKLTEDPNLPLIVLSIPNFGEQQIDWTKLSRDATNGIIKIEKITIREDRVTAGSVTASSVRPEDVADSSAK